jgi:SAM-dependent methyltransferase
MERAMNAGNERRAKTIRAALRAASERSDAYQYPDFDNHMEDTVFAERDGERRAWEELFSRMPRARDGIALDAGCGLGAYVAPLRAHFADAVFVDGDARRAAATALVAGEGVPGTSVFAARLDGDALGAPELVGAFSFVQCLQVLGHVPQDAALAVVRRLASLLAHDGRLLLAVPFCEGPEDQFLVVSGEPGEPPRSTEISSERYDRLATIPKAAELPVRHFSMSSVRALCADVGLILEDAQRYHQFEAGRGDLFAVSRRAGA